MTSKTHNKARLDPPFMFVGWHLTKLARSKPVCIDSHRSIHGTSGLCGKFGNKPFTATATATATAVRARRKNTGIAGPASNFFNAAMAAVASIRVTELSKQPTSLHYS